MMVKNNINSRKVQGISSTSVQIAGNYLAIVEVREKNYVPAGVKVRKWISDFIFTAEVRSSEFDRLEQNPSIASVQLNQLLPQV